MDYKTNLDFCENHQSFKIVIFSDKSNYRRRAFETELHILVKRAVLQLSSAFSKDFSAKLALKVT